MFNPTWVHFLREQEVKMIIEIIQSYQETLYESIKILEIGSGDGYMASKFKNLGFDIVCIEPQPRNPQYHPIVKSIASELPFLERSFDIIFSSNVLEHIYDLPTSIQEMQRVLKRDGIMIHSMPTVACSILTTLTSPIAYPRSVFLLLSGYYFKRRDLTLPFTNRTVNKFQFSNQTHQIIRKIAIICKILNPLRIFRLTRGHGTAFTPFHEIFAWRKKTWTSLFSHYGYITNRIIPHPLSATMNKLFGKRFIRFREFLSKLGLQSSNMYVFNLLREKQ